MKIKIFPGLFIIFFLIIFYIFYKGLQNSSIYIPNANITQNIPSFESKIFGTNKKIKSEDFFNHNQFYLFNIWSSWCVPCRDEHPFLMNLKSDKNIKIVGLNYKDNNENSKKFLNELSNPYDTIFLDEDGLIAIEWGAYGVPESFLIYNDKIIKKIIGPLNQNLILEIKSLIK